MEQPSFDKTTVEHQYDTLIKKVLIGEAKNAKARNITITTARRVRKAAVNLLL